jgi:response regulator RpfG family c-di-GMP phosphodiesterase
LPIVSRLFQIGKVAMNNQKEEALGVLVVEDQDDLPEALGRYLSLDGYYTRVTRTGEEGLAILQEAHSLIHFVVLDLRLP